MLKRAALVPMLLLAGCQYCYPAAVPAKTTGQIVVAATFPNPLSTKVIPDRKSVV